MLIKRGFWFKEVIYIGISRFGTTGHVWYREASAIEGDSFIEGVQFRGVLLYCMETLMRNS